MDELDKLIQENKGSFDRIRPDKILWSSIAKSLNKISGTKSISSRRKSWMGLKIAASIILLVGASVVWMLSVDSHSQFKNLSMESPNGETIVLDPSLNKFTLIQFWASGNVLCSEENCYYYLPAYNKYKDRGFEIYAISLDQDKEEWIRGIEENELSWIHVSDLKGWESPICIECNISKVPTSFLLDHEGNVILEDVNAEVLDETLGRLLANN
ncbi:MAG: TlpA family protein disulfide reductase [Flavobacteriales bacterium]|nr:TlpA family protein disulfide reductase [Flavobacteriales bacterium]